MTTGYQDTGKKRVAATVTSKIRKKFKGVALDSWRVIHGFFAGNFCDNFGFNKVRWPTPFFFATFFFGGMEKKKVAKEFEKLIHHLKFL